jgi:hypothetical protein
MRYSPRMFSQKTTDYGQVFDGMRWPGLNPTNPKWIKSGFKVTSCIKLHDSRQCSKH